MWACGVGLPGLGFRVRDRVMVGVRVRVGVKFNAFYFLSHLQPVEGVGVKSRMERAGTLECSVTGQPAKMTSCEWLLKQRCSGLDLIHFR